MIPQDFISEWKKAAPWTQNDHVEQDLIICRAVLEIRASKKRMVCYNWPPIISISIALKLPIRILPACDKVY